MIVSFAEKSTPVWKIPFPAITICPETKAKTSFANFTVNYNLIQGSEPPFDNLTDDA